MTFHLPLWLTADDHTNLHRHARRNAQEAIVLARQRAQAFDTQAALDRKTNEALQLAKHQAHIRDDAESQTNGPYSMPLVDRTWSRRLASKLLLINTM